MCVCVCERERERRARGIDRRDGTKTYMRKEWMKWYVNLHVLWRDETVFKPTCGKCSYYVRPNAGHLEPLTVRNPWSEVHTIEYCF